MEKILVVAEKKSLAERLVIAASNSRSALMLCRFVRGFVHAGGRGGFLIGAFIGAFIGRGTAIWVLIVFPLMLCHYLASFVISH